MDKSSHRFQYRHPCKYGVKCKHTKIMDHKRRYSHPCVKGEKCDKMQNKEHTNYFLHPCKYGMECRMLQKCNPEHIRKFFHVDNEKGVELKVNWPSSWKNPLPADIKKIKSDYLKIVPVPQSSPEYTTSQQFFKKSFNGAHTIIKIERIENYRLWKWYSIFKSDMEKRLNKNTEGRYFHGTKAGVIKLICENGFDHRVGYLAGRYGNGKLSYNNYDMHE
jgi:hypothetical protein